MTDLAVGNFSGSIIKAGYEEEVFSGTIASGETLVINKALSLAPPTISNIAVSNITGKSAVITWDTDQPADSFIEFGETVAYGQSLGDTTSTTTHRLKQTTFSKENHIISR